MFLLLIITPTRFGHNSLTSSGSQRVYRRTQLVWNFAEEMYLHLSLSHKLPHKVYTSINLLAPEDGQELWPKHIGTIINNKNVVRQVSNNLFG